MVWHDCLCLILLGGICIYLGQQGATCVRSRRYVHAICVRSCKRILLVYILKVDKRIQVWLFYETVSRVLAFESTGQSRVTLAHKEHNCIRVLLANECVRHAFVLRHSQTCLCHSCHRVEPEQSHNNTSPVSRQQRTQAESNFRLPWSMSHSRQPTAS